MSEAKGSPAIRLLLILLPLWLVASGLGAMWYYFHLEKKETLVEQEKFGRAVSAPMIEDDLRKIVEVIGERNTASTEAGANLGRMSSMIEGLLGPSNTGYAVRKIPGPADWPLLQVTLAGRDSKAPAVWVIAGYDSPVGSRGAEANASGVAATLAAAQALASDKPAVPIHFLFVPHVYDTTGPVAETIAKIAPLVAPADTVFCVEAMGEGEKLWLSPQRENTPQLPTSDDLGHVIAPAVSNPDGTPNLANLLAVAGISAVRISTRPTVTADETSDRSPFAPTVAAAAGRLVELIRRSSNQ